MEDCALRPTVFGLPFDITQGREALERQPAVHFFTA